MLASNDNMATTVEKNRLAEILSFQSQVPVTRAVDPDSLWIRICIHFPSWIQIQEEKSWEKKIVFVIFFNKKNLVKLHGF